MTGVLSLCEEEFEHFACSISSAKATVRTVEKLYEAAPSIHVGKLLMKCLQNSFLITYCNDSVTITDKDGAVIVKAASAAKAAGYLDRLNRIAALERILTSRTH